MHDIAFVKNIMSQIENSDDVSEVFIEVGDISGIEADHLKEHLEEASGWRVNASTVPSKVRCDCGYEGEAKVKERLHDLVIFSCPECDAIPDVLEGDKIKIIKVIYK